MARKSTAAAPAKGRVAVSHASIFDGLKIEGEDSSSEEEEQEEEEEEEEVVEVKRKEVKQEPSLLDKIVATVDEVTE